MSAQSDMRHLVSVVIPALNEADNVPELLSRTAALVDLHPHVEFELVVVDDGSTDGTADLAVARAPGTFRVKTVVLSRNFGSHQAISAGLRACSGDAAIVLGADGQEPLTLVAQFFDEWEGGADVVWGVRHARTRSWRAELPSKAFSHLFTKYADLANYPAEGPSGVLVDRRVIDELNRLSESNRNVLALIAWLGFRQTRVGYDQLPRQHGESRWTARKMVKLAVDSLIQFSSMPLRLCTFTGIAVAAIGFVYAIALVVMRLAGVSTPSGWPTLLVVILVLGGFQLLVIGIMGEYLWRGVEEVRGRPLYVVRDITMRESDVTRGVGEGVRPREEIV